MNNLKTFAPSQVLTPAMTMAVVHAVRPGARDCAAAPRCVHDHARTGVATAVEVGSPRRRVQDGLSAVISFLPVPCGARNRHLHVFLFFWLALKCPRHLCWRSSRFQSNLRVERQP